VRTHSEYSLRPKRYRIADLKSKTAELERRLSDARLSLEREVARSARNPDAAFGNLHETCRCGAGEISCDHELDEMLAAYAAPDAPSGYDSPVYDDQLPSSEARTEVFVNHGRRSAYHPRLSRRHKMVIGAAIAAVLITILVIVLSGRGASWPPSVATVQAEAAKACQNPNVASEPGQVNFACAQGSRQILWVFALMTSADNPGFADAKTGRLGLEPIAPSQGGEMAWSLNLHHPYDPSNPVDSLQVAARAINNIIAGATLTSAAGKPVIQAGLEGSSANCVRYTGSGAVTARKGYPGLCARPVASAAGEAALVADVYQKWVVGAAPKAAQDAAVLFENSDNPGSLQVQAILKHLGIATSLA
jgi:hypothetical protein